MKRFLKTNKIYFEILSSIFLGGMAVIVSINANSIAASQLEVAKKTQELDMLQHLPEIKSNFERIRRNDGKQKEKLTISNVGNELYEFNSSPIAFLAIRELQIIDANQEPEKNENLKVLKNPLLEYYPHVSFVTNNDKGYLQSLETNDDTLAYNECFKFNDLYKTQHKEIDCQIERFLKVSYKDKFHHYHVDYFKFSPFGESIPLTTEEGIAIYENYNANINKGESFHLDKINMKKINFAWISYGAKNITKT